MRTFAQKQNQSQKQVSPSLARSNTAALGLHHRADLILHLQRTIGNQAVQRMLQTHAEELKAGLTGTTSPRFGHDFSRIPIHPPAARAIQTKLTINKPGDEYEQEADRVSEQVMRMPEPQLQRACACGGGCPRCRMEQPGQEHVGLQTKPQPRSNNNSQHSKPPSAQQTPSTGASAIIREMLSSPGHPLDPATRLSMESRFRHNFSRVRVHTDAEAVQMSRGLNADAFAIGKDIYFGAGKYAPNTVEGRVLLAHELTHAVQAESEGSQAMPREWKVSQSTDPSEQEAHLIAYQVVFAHSDIHIHQRGSATLQRQPSPSGRKEQQREAFLKDLAKWPHMAHQQWKRLELSERAAVIGLMGVYYGGDFAAEFLQHMKSPTLVSFHYGPGFPELTPQWFQARGYRLAQSGRGYDSVLEWWVHPSGKSIMNIRTGPRPPAKVPPEDECPALADATLSILRDTISTETAVKKDLEGQKGRLEQMDKTTDDYREQYDDYIQSLQAMKARLEATVEDIETMRKQLEEMNCSAVSTVDDQLQELSDLQIWADIESSPMSTQFLQPLKVRLKD